MGQYLGIGALYSASALVALLALAVPAVDLKWLGLVPIALAARQLWQANEAAEEAPAAAGMLAVATVTVANGGDNLGVYIPLFATSSAPGLAAYGAVFAVMTGLWCLGARWLVGHPRARAPLRRWGPRTVPYVLAGVGLWILLR